MQYLYEKADEKCNQFGQQLNEVLHEKQQLENDLTRKGEESALSLDDVKNREEQLISGIHEQEDRLQSQTEVMNNLYESLARREQELVILLASNALFISILIPLFENNSLLAAQKQMLMQEFNRLDKLRKQVIN